MNKLCLWSDDHKLNSRFGVYSVVREDNQYRAYLLRTDEDGSHGSAETAYVGTLYEVKAKVEKFLREVE